MPEVAILIGLQASGKTTFYRRVTDTLAAGRDVAADNTSPSAA